MYMRKESFIPMQFLPLSPQKCSQAAVAGFPCPVIDTYVYVLQGQKERGVQKSGIYPV